MKKTLALGFLFVFTLAITTPAMAAINPQEPVKKEQTDKKKKCEKECEKECKKEAVKECKKECGEMKSCEKKKEKKG